MTLITKNDQFMREFFNHTIGFDNLFDRLTLVRGKEAGFPPYNIISTKQYDDDKLTFVELAIAGYSKDDIDVTVEDGVLIIEGKSSKSPLSLSLSLSLSQAQSVG